MMILLSYNFFLICLYYLSRWLLDHEPSLRPTCAELLASEHVPRPVPEGHLSGLLSHALSDRGSRGYQRLISACLDQQQSAAEDYTYHNDMRVKPLEALSRIKDAVIKVCDFRLYFLR